MMYTVYVQAFMIIRYNAQFLLTNEHKLNNSVKQNSDSGNLFGLASFWTFVLGALVYLSMSVGTFVAEIAGRMTCTLAEMTLQAPSICSGRKKFSTENI